MSALGYLLEHNRSHADELDAISRKLDAAGDHGRASLIRQAVALFASGNELVARALD
ncbi:MAG: hypothetical protein LBL83_12485 [Clostridiales bacterium]|nr:hypothetical protein [Clostridiales bacterium]